MVEQRAFWFPGGARRELNQQGITWMGCRKVNRFTAGKKTVLFDDRDQDQAQTDMAADLDDSSFDVIVSLDVGVDKCRRSAVFDHSCDFSGARSRRYGDLHHACEHNSIMQHDPFGTIG